MSKSNSVDGLNYEQLPSEKKLGVANNSTIGTPMSPVKFTTPRKKRQPSFLRLYFRYMTEIVLA